MQVQLNGASNGSLPIPQQRVEDLIKRSKQERLKKDFERAANMIMNGLQSFPDNQELLNELEKIFRNEVPEIEIEQEQSTPAAEASKPAPAENPVLANAQRIEALKKELHTAQQHHQQEVENLDRQISHLKRLLKPTPELTPAPAAAEKTAKKARHEKEAKDSKEMEPDEDSFDIAMSLLALQGIATVKKSELNKQDKEGNAFLHQMIMGNTTETAILEKIIKHGAKINLQNKEGNTPLHLAAMLNNEEWVAALIRARADIAVTNKKSETPLAIAVLLGHESIIKLLDPTQKK